MIRWIFAALLIANLFPALLAESRAPNQTPAPRAGALGATDPGVRTLVLLGEAQPESGEVERRDEESHSLPQRREQACFLVGPLVSMATAEAIAGQLESSGLTLEKRWREVAGGVDYWVHLPPQPSMRATTRVLQELKANNIDSFVFSEGELDGAIALGVYSDQAAAETQRQRFVELGYDASVYGMERLLREYWLLSDTVPDPGALDGLTQILGDREIGQNISPRSCLAVASAMHFQ